MPRITPKLPGGHSTERVDFIYEHIAVLPELPDLGPILLQESGQEGEALRIMLLDRGA